MRNKGKLCGFFSIAILGLCLFVLAGAASAVETQPGYGPEKPSFGEILKTTLASLQKPQVPVKAPAIRKADAKSFPPIMMPAEMALNRYAPGDLLEMRLAVLKKTAAPYQKKVASKPFPSMHKMVDNDMDDVVAGAYCLKNAQGTVMDEGVGYWVKITRKTHTDVQQEPYTHWLDVQPHSPWVDAPSHTPWLDVPPYTWFLIDHVKVHKTYYKWWEQHYQNYGKKYWQDAEFDVSGTYYSKGSYRHPYDPPKTTVKYDAYVLESRFQPEVYEYNNVKINAQGDRVFRSRTVSCEMRRGYAVFFE